MVSTDWLAARLGATDLVVVDASWYLPAMNRSARAEYQAGHIAGAVYADLDTLSDSTTALPHMFPAPDTLGTEIGRLGIRNDSRIVVYDGSGNNLSAARFWWTLRVLGHDAVAVLDGGVRRWQAEGRPLEAGTVQPALQAFRVKFRPELIRSEAEILSAIAAGSAQLVDARSRGRFEGTEPEPRPGLRGGHLPGAKSVPYAELTGPGDTMLRPDALRARFEQTGIDLSRPVIASCGSGVSACALLLGLEVIGHFDHALYDGSWSEWGREGGPAIER